MQANDIPKVTLTLEERGIPSDSYFKIIFVDGSERSEHDLNWSMISAKETVNYFGYNKVVHLCKLPIKKIEAYHDGLFASIDVPEGSFVYQAIRGDTLIVPNYHRIDRIIGRLIGMVKDGEITEELLLDGLQYKVVGMRK